MHAVLGHWKSKVGKNWSSSLWSSIYWTCLLYHVIIPLQFRGHYSVSGSPSVHVALQTTVTFTDVSTGPSELLLSTSDIVRQLPHDFLYPFFVANGNAHSSMLRNDSCMVWTLLLMHLLHACVHFSVFWIHCIITVIHWCFRQTVVNVHFSMNRLWTDSDCRLFIINAIFVFIRRKRPGC